MDTLPANNVSPDIDALLNVNNVIRARHARLVQALQPSEPRALQNTRDESDDDNDITLPESAGIGSRNLQGRGDDVEDEMFTPRNPASKEKLLEQLLGPKAAQARRKLQEQGRPSMGGNATAHKSVVSRPKQAQQQKIDSEDEDEGRAAAFTSRRKKSTGQDIEKRVKLDANSDKAVVGEIAETAAVKKMKAERAESESASDTEVRPGKRKTGSYLDEVLAKKNKKKAKK